MNIARTITAIRLMHGINRILILAGFGLAGVGVSALLFLFVDLDRINASEPPLSTTRFPGSAAPHSPYQPSICLDRATTPDPTDCSWWVSQRGDVWIPWQSALIVPAGPQPNSPSGGHVMARDAAHLGPAMVLEVASLKGLAVTVNRKGEPGQANAVEIPNPSRHGEVYFPGRVAVGERADTFIPESAVTIPHGYLQLRVWANEAPADDCQWPKHGGRVAVVIEAETGADTMGLALCGPDGWQEAGG